MARSKQPIPSGFHTVTPYLTVRDAAAAIEIYKKALGAEEIMRMPTPDGKIGHAELKIGDSIIFLADEFPQMGNKSPQTLGGSTGGLYLYVEDVDKAFKRATDPGATVKMPVTDIFPPHRYRHPPAPLPPPPPPPTPPPPPPPPPTPQPPPPPPPPP